MGKNRYFNSDFWVDPWVVDNLDPLESHLFIYLFTNPQARLCGIYRLSLRVMAFQVGIEKDKLLNMLKRLEPKVFYVDDWIVMVNGIKNQNYRNEKIKTAILRELKDVPNHILQHLYWPPDFGEKRPKGSDQTQLIDESYMTYDESLHSNSNSNLIKSNPAVPSGSPAAHGLSKLNKAQKRTYAIAVQADREQTERADLARSRKPASTETIEEIFG